MLHPVLKKVVLIHFIHFSLTDLLNVPYPYHNRFTKKQKIMSTIIANYLLSIGTVQTVQKQIATEHTSKLNRRYSFRTGLYYITRQYKFSL